MIPLHTITESWSASEFGCWAKAYEQNLPVGKKILLALEHPFHQLAALLAALSQNRHVLLLAANAKPLEIELMHRLFLPDATITQILSSPASTMLDQMPLGKNATLGVATSGSSGTPKIVLHTPDSLWASAGASVKFYNTCADDLIASVLPLHHIGGIMPFWRAFVAKASLALPAKQWQDVLQLKPTQISLVPNQLQTLLEQNHDWGHQRCVIMGAQALSESLYLRAVNASVPLSVSYGSSESGAQLCATPIGQHPQGSVGFPLEARQVRLIEGRIAFKGPATFYAYQDGEKIVRPFDQDGFFITQDLGHFDQEGRLHVDGRADHIYKSGGENVNPLQLEKIISDFTQCQEVLVVPVDDQDFGQLTTAFIRPFTPANASAIKKLNHDLKSEQKIRHLHRDFPAASGIKVSRAQASLHMQQKIERWHLTRLNPRQKKFPDLVLLHGFMGDRSSLQKLGEFFSAHFNVWSLDLPFHGKHQDASLHSWDEVIDELHFILMRFSQLWLYGYSMGGRLALGLKQRYPDSITRLIIEGAHPGLKTANEKQARSQWQEQTAKSMLANFPSFLSQWYRSDLFQLSDEQIDHLVAMTKPQAKSYAQALALYGLAAQPDLSQMLDDSVIYVAGENDAKYRTQVINPVLIANCAHKASYQDPCQVYHSVMQEIARRSWHLS